jgi:hypothetical protein
MVTASGREERGAATGGKNLIGEATTDMSPITARKDRT